MANRIYVVLMKTLVLVFALSAEIALSQPAPVAPERPAQVETPKPVVKKLPASSRNLSGDRVIPPEDPIVAKARADVFREVCMRGSEFKGKRMYYGKQLRARVIDFKSREPVEGVLVFAVWGSQRVDGEGIVGSGRPGIAHTVEVFTDKDGYFTIPAWGPLPLFAWHFREMPFWNRPEGRVNANPRLTLFKEGYGTRVGEPDDRDDYGRKSLVGNPLLIEDVPGESEYNGMDIPLGRLMNSDPRNAKWSHANFAIETDHVLASLSDADYCAWERTPNSVSTAWRWVKFTRDPHNKIGESTVLSSLLACDRLRVETGCKSFKSFVDGVK